MSLKSSPTRYGTVAIAIHWVTALAIIGMLISGLVAENSTDAVAELGILRVHAIMGVLVGVLTILLLIPTLLVWALVEERAERATEVSARIAAGWGGPQIVNGPYIAVPVAVNRSQTVNGTTSTVRVTEWALLMPEELKVDAKLATEARRLSIYSLPVYNAKMAFSGRFGTDLVRSLQQVEGVSNEEVGAQLLTLQTRMQASLQFTSMLYQTSLVNYIK